MGRDTHVALSVDCENYTCRRVQISMFVAAIQHELEYMYIIIITTLVSCMYTCTLIDLLCYTAVATLSTNHRCNSRIFKIGRQPICLVTVSGQLIETRIPPTCTFTDLYSYRHSECLSIICI